MLKAVMFDLDDTLLWDERSVKLAFEATCSLAEVKYGIRKERLEEAVRNNARALYEGYDTYEFTKNIGINPFEGLWGVFDDPGEGFRKMNEIISYYQQEAWTKGLKEAGVDDPEFGKQLAATFPEERKKTALLFEDAIEILDQLKGRYKLLLLTNGSPGLQNTKLELTPELVPYFDEILISGDFGKGKPDPAIFSHALELLNVKKDEAIMVGDNLNTDILGARLAGVPSVWINRKGMHAEAERAADYEIAKLSELLPILEKHKN